MLMVSLFFFLPSSSHCHFFLHPLGWTRWPVFIPFFRPCVQWCAGLYSPTKVLVYAYVYNWNSPNSSTVQQSNVSVCVCVYTVEKQELVQVWFNCWHSAVHPFVGETRWDMVGFGGRDRERGTAVMVHNTHTCTHTNRNLPFSFFLFLTCCIYTSRWMLLISSVSSSWALTLMRHAVECDGYFVHIETVTRQRRKGNKKCGLLVFVTVK